MKALVYTGTQELVYRDEVNPSEISGESILKVHDLGLMVVLFFHHDHGKHAYQIHIYLRHELLKYFHRLFQMD